MGARLWPPPCCVCADTCLPGGPAAQPGLLSTMTGSLQAGSLCWTPPPQPRRSCAWPGGVVARGMWSGEQRPLLKPGCWASGLPCCGPSGSPSPCEKRAPQAPRPAQGGSLRVLSGGACCCAHSNSGLPQRTWPACGPMAGVGEWAWEVSPAFRELTLLGSYLPKGHPCCS